MVARYIKSGEKGLAVYRLRNPWQKYDWGSPSAIPEFMGVAATGEPVAELWLGTHDFGPSEIADSSQLLSDTVGRIPFMLKLLAPERPLSIQVHPASEDAAEGYAKENAFGIPIDSVERTYKDPYAKPEMVYALTTFDTLVGFRPTAEILRMFAIADTKLANRLMAQLQNDPGFAGIVRLVESILLDDSVTDDDLVELIERCSQLADAGVDVRRAFLSVVELAKHFPRDRGLLVSMLMNRLTLQPGEAAYLEPGIIHAHMSGMCVELQGASDNVLRAGFTNKHIDVQAMLNTLRFGMSRLSRVSPLVLDDYTEVFQLPDFALAVTGSPNNDVVPLGFPVQKFVMCIGGEAVISNSTGETLNLARGESLYADESDGELFVSGTCEIVQAFRPETSEAIRATDLI